MKSNGKKIAKEVRRNIMLEKMYDLFTYVALVAMAVGIVIVIGETLIW